jgi:superfamily II DNA helicase RecQ
MAYQTFRLPVAGSPEQAETLNAFLRGHSVVVVRKEWVAAGLESFWAFCVEYHEFGAGPTSGGRAAALGKVDYKEVLTADQFAVFAGLRILRKTLAERDAVPVFAVFTNEQLAEMVRLPARTVADLAKIHGIGEARVTKYGKAVLAELARLPQDKPIDAAGEQPL